MLNYSMAKKIKTRPMVKPRFKIRNRRRTFFKAWRKKRGLTIIEAAELSGMSQGNISAVERGGEGDPDGQGYTQDTLEALADAYKVPPGWLTDFDPNAAGDIVSIWQRAKPEDRKKIIEIATTIVGKTGTEN